MCSENDSMLLDSRKTILFALFGILLPINGLLAAILNSFIFRLAQSENSCSDDILLVCTHLFRHLDC